MPTPEQSKARTALSAFELALSSGNSANLDRAEVLDIYKELVLNLFKLYEIDARILRACVQIEELKKVPAKNTFSRTNKLNNIKACLKTDIEDVQKEFSNIPTKNEVVDVLSASNQLLIKLINPQQDLKTASSISYHATQSLIPPPRESTPTLHMADVSLAPVAPTPHQPATTLVH